MQEMDWQGKWPAEGETAFIGLLEPHLPRQQESFDISLKTAFVRVMESNDGYPWRRWPYMFLRWMVLRAQRTNIDDEAGFWQALGEPFSASLNQQKIRDFYRGDSKFFVVHLARWEGSFYFVNQILLQSVSSPRLAGRARAIADELKYDPDWKRYILDRRIPTQRAGQILKEIAGRADIADSIYSCLLDAESGVHQHLIDFFRHLDASDMPVSNYDLIPAPIVKWLYDWELQRWSDDGPVLHLATLPLNCRWNINNQNVQGKTFPLGICDEITAKIIESGVTRRHIQIPVLPISLKQTLRRLLWRRGLKLWRRIQL